MLVNLIMIETIDADKAVPSRITWRRPLMVRQPYSVAVLSTGGRLHPSFLRREGLVRMWSSLWLKGDGGIRKMPFLMGKSDANECNESLLSNCRVQLALSTKKDGMILEKKNIKTQYHDE